MSLAIFILPEGAFNTELDVWKERVKKELPGQPYTAHPPHMTLIKIEIENEKYGIDAVSAFSDFVDPFQVLVNRRDVFWDDTATGGHTIFFGIEKNNALYSLQKSLAEVLQPVKKNVPLPNYLTGNKQSLESFDRYGFPFVGDHWIPHFSVSSLRTEKTHPTIKDFLSSTDQYHFTANKISLWQVERDKHIQLETIYFK